MDAANKSYELHMLKIVINNHLDRTLPSDANKALYLIQYQIDNLVCIATSIYRQSGHKVDFSSIRDLASTRIESLRLLALKQAEEARQKAETEARRKKEDEAKQIEEARREQEAEERKKVEEERQKKEKEKEITKIRKIYQSKGINQEIFEKIKSITVDQLEVEADRITPETSFANDLGADSQDMMELIMAIEEEFDTELPEMDDYMYFRPLFSSEQEDEPFDSSVTVEILLKLVQEKIF